MSTTTVRKTGNKNSEGRGHEEGSHTEEVIKREIEGLNRLNLYALSLQTLSSSEHDRGVSSHLFA